MIRPIAAVFIVLLMLLALNQWWQSAEKAKVLTEMREVQGELQCSELGGELSPVCMSGYKMCIIQYEDAGKSCISSSQCQGECRVYEKKWDKLIAKGQCSSSNNPCGCWANVELGMVVHRVCHD